MILNSARPFPLRCITVLYEVVVALLIRLQEPFVLEDHGDVEVGVLEEEEGESCMNPALALTTWYYPYLRRLPLVVKVCSGCCCKLKIV